MNTINTGQRYQPYDFDTKNNLTIAEEQDIAKAVLNGDNKPFIKQYTNLIYDRIHRVCQIYKKTPEDHVIDRYHIDILSYLIEEGVGKWDPKKGRKLSSWVALISQNRTKDYFKKVDIYTQTFGFNIESLDGFDESNNKEAYQLDQFLMDNNIIESFNHMTEFIDENTKIELRKEAIHQLSMDEKKVITYDHEGLSNEEIGKKMKINKKRVASIKHKAETNLIAIIHKKLSHVLT